MALAGRGLILPDLGSACTEGRGVLAPRAQVTPVAQAERAGVAEHGQCQAGDSCCRGDTAYGQGWWHMRDTSDLAVPLPRQHIKNFHQRMHFPSEIRGPHPCPRAELEFPWQRVTKPPFSARGGLWQGPCPLQQCPVCPSRGHRVPILLRCRRARAAPAFPELLRGHGAGPALSWPCPLSPSRGL